MQFADSWLWLIFAGIGLLVILVDFIIGIGDLLFLGSVFIIGGLATWPFHSWPITVIVTSIISIAYITLGRRYARRWTTVREEKTNIDTIIGRRGLVVKNIARYADGRIKIDNLQWRARADEDINEGDEVVVLGVKGATLIVNKIQGGD